MTLANPLRTETEHAIRDALSADLQDAFMELCRERNNLEDARDMAESEAEELKEQVKSLEEERDGELDDLTDALETVKYWFHDFLVLGKPCRTPPQRMLKIVEGVLDQ